MKVTTALRADRARMLLATFLLAATSSSWVLGQSSTPQFVPGELLVGYGSKADRDTALSRISSEVSTKSARGASAGRVSAAPVGGKSVKVMLELPSLRGTAPSDPQEELRVLEELAGQL